MKREIKFRAWLPKYSEMVVLEDTGLQNYDCENGYSIGFTVDGYTDITSSDWDKYDGGAVFTTEQLYALFKKEGEKV